MNARRSEFQTKPTNPARKRRAAATGAVVGGKGESLDPGPGRIDPKWAWHHRALLRLQDRLLVQRGEQLAKVGAPLEPHSMDLADSASDEYDHNLALSELSAEQDALFEIDEALKRIANGTYGVCEATGKAIPPERLKAVPWTRFVKEVEARLEGEGAIRRRHLGALGSVRANATDGLEGSESEEEKAVPDAEDEVLQREYSPPGKHFDRRK